MITSPGFDPSELEANDDNETVLEDSGTTSLAVVDNDDFGPNGAGTTAIVIPGGSEPGNGTAMVDDNGTPNDPRDDQVDYTPDADFLGTDSFKYQVEDATTTISTATVTVTVEPVNDVPSFTKGADQTVLEDAGAQTVNGWATAISTGPVNESGQTPSFNVSNDNNALFATQPSINATGDLSYTPADDANGSALVSVSLSDDGGTANGGNDTSSVETFTITVNAVDDPPIAVDDAASVSEDAPATTIDVMANDTDIDGGPKSIDSITPPSGGTVTITNGGADLTYEPDANVCNDGSPTDDFTYTLTPGSSTGTVAMTVTCVNDTASGKPAAGDDVAEVDEDDSVTIAVLANDDFGDDGAGTTAVEIIDGANNGTATVDDGGTAIDPTDDTIVYEPDDDFFGTDAFDYRITDADGDTARATVQLSIAPVNDAPAVTLAGDQASLSGAGEQIVSAFATGFDPGPNESQGIAGFLVSNDDNDLFDVQPAIATDGTLTYSPNTGNLEGTATVTVQVRDDGGTANGGTDVSEAQTFTIAIGVSIEIESDLPDSESVRARIGAPEDGVANWVFDEQASEGVIAVEDDTNSPATPPPADLEFPYELFGFTLVQGEAGSDAFVTLSYPDALPADARYWKYDTEADSWFPLPPERVNIEGSAVTLQLTDGGVGDLDGSADSRIIDPGGIAIGSGKPVSVPVGNSWLFIGLLFLTLGLVALPALHRQTGAET